VQFILFMDSTWESRCCCAPDRLWQRLRAAPLSRAMLLGSRATSAALIAGFILFVLFSFARLVFGVHIQGSFAVRGGMRRILALMTAAFGLMVAALGETPEATAYSIMVTLIMEMLRRMVPTFVFPQWLQKKTTRGDPNTLGHGRLDAMSWRGLDFLPPSTHRCAAALHVAIRRGGGDALPLEGRGLGAYRLTS